MSTILIVASLVAFAIVALLGFEVLDGSYLFGWLGLAGGLYVAADLVP